MNDSELINKANAIASCLSYNDDTNAGNPKAMIRELCHRLGAKSITIEWADGGYRLQDLYGFIRYLTKTESLLWLLFKMPPRGMDIAKGDARVNPR